ncbi:MAG: GspH/FimT family protein [Rubrivivax sp.]|nr:GspH/FimT family protein [Pyrinomonadaceae bacterium]
MRLRKHFSGRQSDGGFSMIELLVVVAVVLVVSAIGIPQLVSSRRLIRSAGLSREMLTQMRFARQEAMSQRQAVTFSYDNSTKEIKIIDHQTSNKTLLTDAAYPNTAGSLTVRTFMLAGGGVPASEISHGIPSGLPTTPLDDTTTMTALSNNKFNVTFFPDGSATNNANATKMAFFFYNPTVPSKTAMAISVLGSGGRVKVWRYNSGGNKYYE